MKITARQGGLENGKKTDRREVKGLFFGTERRLVRSGATRQGGEKAGPGETAGMAAGRIDWVWLKRGNLNQYFI